MPQSPAASQQPAIHTTIPASCRTPRITDGATRIPTDNPFFHTIEAQNTFRMFAGGDEAALNWLYKQFYGPLVRYGCRRLDDEFEVATIVQEAFIQLWGLRARIASLLHAWRFLRLKVRWGCADYYKQPAVTFRRHCMHYVEWVENLPGPDEEEDRRRHQRHEELAQAVYKVIPYLPPTAQTIMALHFRHGFTVKQIAGRFRASNRSIGLELQKSLHHLQTMLQLAKKPQQRRPCPCTDSPVPAFTTAEETVFHLRTIEKKSFDDIALTMAIPRQGVEQLYIKAWREKEQRKKAKKEA